MFVHVLSITAHLAIGAKIISVFSFSLFNMAGDAQSPERKKRKVLSFPSFCESSPEEAALHVFDSPKNKKLREAVFSNEYLVMGEARDLEGWWRTHCSDKEFPGLDDHPMIIALGDEWAQRTLKVIHDAFPCYKRYDYTLSQVIVAETIQHRFMMEQHRPAALFCIEGMSGMRNLSHAFTELGMVALSLDRKYTSKLDFATSEGVLNFLLSLRSLHRFGLAWFGVECSSWVWVGRSGTHRCEANPEGRRGNKKVDEANRVRDCMCFLMILLTESGRKYVVEQPTSSLLNVSEAFATALAVTSGDIVNFDHAAYEDDEEEYKDLGEDEERAATKSLKAMGTPEWLPRLCKRCDRSVKREKLTDHNKEGKVSGKPDALKQSEHYCKTFGRWVASLQMSYVKDQLGEGYSDVDWATI